MNATTHTTDRASAMTVKLRSINGEHGLVHPRSGVRCGLFRRAAFGDRLASFIAQTPDGTLVAGRFGPGGFWCTPLDGEAEKAAYRVLMKNDEHAPDPEHHVELPECVAQELPPVRR